MYQRTPKALRGALTQLERAIAQDSSYAPAYAGLATVYARPPPSTMVTPGSILQRGRNRRALALADRAIALDSTLAEGYSARGYTLTWSQRPVPRSWPTSSMRSSFDPVPRTCTSGMPNSCRDKAGMGKPSCRWDVRQSPDPLAPGVRTGYASIAFAARRYDVAEREASRASDFEPSLMFARAQQGTGDPRPTAHEPGTLRWRAGDAPVLAGASPGGGTARRFASHRDRGERGRGLSFSPAIVLRTLAEYFAWTGRAEESMAWIERAFAVSPLGEDPRLSASSIYDRVRADPRFQPSLERTRSRAEERVQRARRSFVEQLSGSTPSTHR